MLLKLTLSPHVRGKILLGHPHFRTHPVQKLRESPVAHGHRCTRSPRGKDSHSALVWCRDRICQYPMNDIMAREQNKKRRAVQVVAPTALRWRKPRAELGRRRRGRIRILRRLVGIQLVRHSDGGRETVRERSGRRELRERVERSLIKLAGNSANSLRGNIYYSPSSGARGWSVMWCALFRKTLPLPPCSRPRFVVAKSSSYNQRDCVKFSATLVGLLPRRLFSSCKGIH